LKELVEALQSGRAARTVPPPADAPGALALLQPLTAKPVLYVANVDEGSGAVPPEIAEYARSRGAAAVAVSARLEAELAELESEEAAAMRAELGLTESGLDAIVRGLSVWHAAGMIHSDIQRGFVRAEVIAWNELVEAGGYAGARDRGILRLEGRDYIVADGDVITVKFTP
jgi:ribosome-binding ATPase YchF (GTP1/OBG family)